MKCSDMKAQGGTGKPLELRSKQGGKERARSMKYTESDTDHSRAHRSVCLNMRGSQMVHIKVTGTEVGRPSWVSGH